MHTLKSIEIDLSTLINEHIYTNKINLCGEVPYMHDWVSTQYEQGSSKCGSHMVSGNNLQNKVQNLGAQSKVTIIERSLPPTRS